MAIHLEQELGLAAKASRIAYRILAILWIFKGFFGACELLGVSIPGLSWMLTSARQSTVYSALFSGLDIVAGVSLWLSIGWGAVIWVAVSIFYSFTVLVFAPGWHSVFSALLVIIFLMVHAGYRITLRKDAFIEKLKRS